MTSIVSRPLSIHQKMVGDAVRIGRRFPYIHALVELDVTDARQHLRTFRKETGQQISFTAYIMSVCATAIHNSPSIQQIYAPGGRSVQYDDVDFFLPLETIHSGKPAITHRLIRNVAFKSPLDLTTILESATNDEPQKLSSLQHTFMRLPWFLRKPIYALWMASPRTRKKYFGTVYFSSIMNYSANRRTWGIPIPMHGLGIFIGTASTRLIQGKSGIESRDMLQLTISVDHRVNNGGDMARFVHQLKHLLENQSLLNEDQG